MKKLLKKAALMLLCIMTMVVPMGGAAAVYATDTSQSYRFDLTVNGGASCEVKAGETVDVAVSLTRTDIGTAESFTMYAVQYDLMVDTRYFTLDESSLNGGGTKGVQTFTTDMSKNGSWAGYKKVTAAAVNASGSQWSNGSIIMKCTLTAVRTGETELKPYNSIVSLSSGRDTYKSEAGSVKVTVTAPADENGGDPVDPGEDNGNNNNPGSGDNGSAGDNGNNGNNSGNTGDNSNSGNTGNNGNSGSNGSSNTGSNGSGSGSGSGSGTSGSDTGNGQYPPSPDAVADPFQRFTDMDSHWSSTYVEYVVKKGYFSGMTNTQFAPDKAMNRAMLVTVLWRMENSPEYSGSSAFSDVKSGIWYDQAVQWAADKGIVSGSGDGRFMPESPLTREQLIQIIRNYAKYKGADVTASSALDSFSDASSVSSWAQDAFKWGIASGMISGTGNNSLSPKGSATRAQVAKILTEFDNKILKTA